MCARGVLGQLVPCDADYRRFFPWAQGLSAQVAVTLAPLACRLHWSLPQSRRVSRPEASVRRDSHWCSHCLREPGSFQGTQWRSEAANAAGGIEASGIALVCCLGHGIDVATGGIHRNIAVCELALHQLELPDGLAELLAGLQVGRHNPERRPSGSGLRQDDPFVVEAAHQHRRTPPRVPSTRSFGIQQSSKTSSPVSLPRMPSLSSF